MENLLLVVLLLIVLIVLLVVCFMLIAVSRNQNEINTSYKLSLQKQKDAAAFTDKQTQSQFSLLQQQVHRLVQQQSSSSSLLASLEGQIGSMNAIMTNSKRRGNWGEYQMETLIRIYAGENPSVYDLQYKLENGKIADGVFHLPGSEKVLCIDSKFPMENYLAIQEEPENADFYLREFRKNMKKHIDDVSDKYITAQTENLAILFIPSEAIYQYVCGEAEDLLHYALGRHVLLTSPTTLAGVVFSLLASSKDFYRAKNLQEIEKALFGLQDDFTRLEQRMNTAIKNAGVTSEALRQAMISLDKCSGRIEQIAAGKDID